MTINTLAFILTVMLQPFIMIYCLQSIAEILLISQPFIMIYCLQSIAEILLISQSVFTFTL
jgi:hypothetical protein